MSNTMRDSQLRVAIYSSNFFRHDGVTITCRRVIATLKSRGAKVRVLTTLPPSGFPATEPLVTSDEIIPIPSMDFVMPTFGGEKNDCEFDGYVMGSHLGRASLRLLEAFEPNIMHVTAPDGGSLAAAMWARRKPGVGLLATWHSNFQDYVLHYPLAWLTRPIAVTWLRFYCAHVPLTLVPTPALREELSGLGFRAREMEVWGRGVDSTVFTPEARRASLRDELGIRHDALVLCWTSRIVREKRFGIFTDVFDRLLREGVPVHALVAGVPSDESGAHMLEDFRKRVNEVRGRHRAPARRIVCCASHTRISVLCMDARRCHIWDGSSKGSWQRHMPSRTSSSSPQRWRRLGM